MEPHHLARLQEEQSKALNDTDKQILQVEKYKYDYQVLQERLRTLPDEINYDIMVPFGKLAFMPGKLVHTNEILVLLGDNWFVDRSAKQAENIALRRIEELNKQLTNLKAQKKLLEPRLEFTSDFQGKDVEEIVEAYDAEKERLWDAQHKKNVQKEREEARNLNLNFPSKLHTVKKQPYNDSDLWARLDALEEQEKNKGELESEDSEEEENDEDRTAHPKVIKSQVQATDVDGQESDDFDDYDERVEGANDGDEEISEDDEDDNSSENVDPDDEKGSKSNKPAVKTIRFTHTDTSSNMSNTADPTAINSPADIYKLYNPASILKKPGRNRKKEGRKTAAAASKAVGFSSDDNDELQEKSQSNTNPIRPLASSSSKAFSGRVLETSQTVLSNLTPTVIEKQHDNATTDELPKRVSKFKASRIAKQGFS